MTSAQEAPAAPARRGLRQRALNASLWTVGGVGLSHVLRLASNLILTRLLVPEMFGVMAIANLALMAIALFADIGIAQALMQSARTGDKHFRDAAWTLQIVRGVILTILMLIFAVLVAFLAARNVFPSESAYANPVLPFVLAAMSATSLISGFKSTKEIAAQRKLDLARVAVLHAIEQIIGLIVLVALAWWTRSIWALVAGSIIGALLRSVLSHIALPGPLDRWRWDRTHIDEIMRYGRWILASSPVGFLVMYADQIFFGFILSDENYGIFVIASVAIVMLRQVTAMLNGNVLMPALSETVREDRKNLRSVYYRCREPFNALTLLAAGGLMTAGDALVDLLYTDNYLRAGGYLQLLAVQLIAWRLAPSEQLFLALGEPHRLVVLSSVQLAALCVFLPLGAAAFGDQGAILALAVAAFVREPVVYRMMARVGIVDLGKELTAFKYLVAGLALGFIAEQVYFRFLSAFFA